MEQAQEQLNDVLGCMKTGPALQQMILLAPSGFLDSTWHSFFTKIQRKESVLRNKMLPLSRSTKHLHHLVPPEALYCCAWPLPNAQSCSPVTDFESKASSRRRWECGLTCFSQLGGNMLLVLVPFDPVCMSRFHASRIRACVTQLCQTGRRCRYTLGHRSMMASRL